MNKLIDQYKANPNLKNAQRIAKYKAKHPFADSFVVDAKTLAEALTLAKSTSLVN
jgi:hypothetical protein